MSLLDKIGNFTAKKIVAPAMILGAGLGLYQAEAQEQTPKRVQVVKGDFDSDGKDDIIYAIYNTDKNQIKLYTHLQEKTRYSSEIKDKHSVEPLTLQLKEKPISIDYTSGNFDNDNKEDLFITAEYPEKIESYTFLQVNTKYSSKLQEKPRNNPITITDRF